MDYLDIAVQIFLLISGLITLYGSYYESKDKRKRFYGFTPRQIVVVGGFLTIALTIINSAKTALDSKQLEKEIQANTNMSKKIDSITTKNIKMTEMITELSRSNYELSNQIQRISSINILKADTLITKADKITEKAQSIINVSTGGESFCIIDLIPLAESDTAFRHIINLRSHPLRNLSVYTQRKEENWSYNTNTVMDYVKTVGTLYPSHVLKNKEVSNKVMMINTTENLAGFNFVPTKINRKERNTRDYLFLADNGFWVEHLELFYYKEKWHKHTIVTKNGKKIYDQKCVF